MDKKAVSPLIASVLLIAFTVALGAVIMTWGRGFVQTQTDKVNVESTGATACTTSVDMDFMIINGAQDICYTTNGYINFTVQNTGTEDILKLKVQTLDSNGNVYNNETKHSGAVPQPVMATLTTGNAAHVQVQVAPTIPAGTTIRQVTIYPVILPTGQTANRTCSNFKLDISNPRTC